ncbi:MAG: hypothetical protein IJT04_01980 [Bacteroidales bacterium]|nr:hypothetical protein [Bacteroidales bacterium]
MKNLKQTFQLLFTALISLSLLFGACKKNEEPENETPVILHEEGIYVLCEGNYNANNSVISFYNSNTGVATTDIFLATNGRGLGDTGNDLQAYGSKLYCIVNNSESVEVMNLSDAKSIKQISLQGKSPRRIVFDKNFGYVSCFDGSVVKIDTATLEVVATAQAGRNPDGICVTNGKLYVANSGGLDFPNYDHTVSVFDLSSFALIKTIEVVCNPFMLHSDDEGDVYLISLGNYNDVASAFQRISSQTDEVVETFDIPVTKFAVSGHTAYLYSSNYFTGETSFMVMDLHTETITNEQFISDGTQITTPYAIFVHPTTGEVYIADAGDYTTNGDVYCFTSNGRKKFSFEVGVCPSQLVYKKAQ